MNPKCWTSSKGVHFLFMKLTKQDIINFISDRENGMPWSELSLKYEIHEARLRAMFKRYQVHGINNLFHKQYSNNYPPSFKKEMCERILNGESKYSLAIKIGINVGTVYSWVKKYQELGYNGLKDNRGKPRKNCMPKKNMISTPLTNSERQELNELRKRNKELEMELEITKKLNALVQKRIERETRKK